jgi:very-short-patch-repair endonuclease
MEIEKEINLTILSYSENNIIYKYFIGSEIAELLGYKNTTQAIGNNVSDFNKIAFKDYKGIKEPNLHARTIIITNDGINELISKNKKIISNDIKKILEKYDINIKKECEEVILEFIESSKDDIEIEKEELTMFTNISNYIYFDYFIGYEVSALLGYANTNAAIINNVSKCNQILFKDFCGPKNIKLNPKTILITRDGCVEMALKTRKRITADTEYILKKFGISTTNMKCLTKEQQTLSIITNTFKTETFEDQYKVGKYYLDLYFTEYKIVIECDENGHADRKPYKERERMDFVNEKLGLEDNNWIRYNPDEKDFDLSKVMGKIYIKINEYKNKYFKNNKSDVEEESEEDSSDDDDKDIEIEESSYEKDIENYKDDYKKLTFYEYDDKKYYVGCEIGELLGYKCARSVNKIVSKENKVSFKDFLGIKEPKLHAVTSLITIEGIAEILVPMKNPLTKKMKNTFFYYNIPFSKKKKKKVVKKVKKIKSTLKKDKVKNYKKNEIKILDSLIKMFEVEKIQKDYKINDLYTIDLFFEEYNIIIDNESKNNPDRKEFINKFMKIDDSYWIFYNNKTSTIDITNNIYKLLKEKNKIVCRICATCKINKPVTDYHKASHQPLGIEYSCKICRSIKNKQRLANKKEKFVVLEEKECDKCKTTKSIDNFWKHIAYKDGYYIYCKDCGIEHRKEQQKINKKEPEKFRTCGKCNILKENSCFYNLESSYDGLNTICKECINERRNEIRNEIRNKKTIIE